MPNPYISGTGFYLPPRVVTNDELATYMDTTDEWIQERTGIKERRYVEPGEGPSDLAIPATEQALEMGLALKVVAAADLFDEVDSVARRITELPAGAVCDFKRVINRACQMDVEGAIE